MVMMKLAMDWAAWANMGALIASDHIGGKVYAHVIVFRLVRLAAEM